MRADIVPGGFQSRDAEIALARPDDSGVELAGSSDTAEPPLDPLPATASS